jgi:hypothetical protein
MAIRDRYLKVEKIPDMRPTSPLRCLIHHAT